MPANATRLALSPTIRIPVKVQSIPATKNIYTQGAVKRKINDNLLFTLLHFLVAFTLTLFKSKRTGSTHDNLTPTGLMPTVLADKGDCHYFTSIPASRLRVSAIQAAVDL